MCKVYLTVHRHNDLFILVGTFCKFVMVLDVHILLSPQEEEVHSSCWEEKKCTLPGEGKNVIILQ